jgi:aconitase A
VQFNIAGIGSCAACSETRISAQPVESNHAPTGPAREFSAFGRLDDPNEVNTYRNGGIMRAMLGRMAKRS